MHNQVFIIGRITKIEQQPDATNYIINVAVNRPFKDEDGIYQTDIIPVVLNEKFYSNLKGVCGINDLIGVKGWLTAENNNLVITADKITFLSSTESKEEQNE